MKLLSLILLVIVMAGSGCSDPVSPPDRYDGTNGVIIDKIAFTLRDNSTKRYENLRIDFGKSSVEFLDAQGIQRGVRLGDYKIERYDVEIILALPASATGAGEYLWVDGTFPTITEAYAQLIRDEVAYPSVSGKTIITKFGPVGGTIEGTFEGVLKHPETGERTEVNGKFTAQRVS